MADQGEDYEKSWILHRVLDRMIGSRETVDIRRKMHNVDSWVYNSDDDPFLYCSTGSRVEGFDMEGSDVDLMFIDTEVKVICSNHDTNISSEFRDKTIAIMRKADCRPCYVTLEMVQMGRTTSLIAKKALVPYRDRLFISSEIYAKSQQELLKTEFRSNMETHGPSSSLKTESSGNRCDIDMVFSYGCTCWPPEANEWLSRPRQHGWPDKGLIYDISQNGCHVVPVGDKTSADTFLQWRISFVTAERKLIHSLSHEQFLVYGLLKYFLKQISGKLKQLIGDVDILSSYIMKTVVFFAIESTSQSLWKEQNTFHCFRLCLKILIAWVKAGNCPNYFIANNNMFQGKLNCWNQERLLCFLIDMYDLKWMCLFIGTFIQPSIGERVERVMNGEWKYVFIQPNALEYERDFIIFTNALRATIERFPQSLALLAKSNSDIDEFMAYINTVKSLSYEGMKKFEEQHTAKGNKQKYKYLRKCKNLLTPFASASTSPGLLLLATFYYQTGNYIEALMACTTMISSFKLYVVRNSDKDKAKYQHMYCGRRYTLLHKCQEVVVYYLNLAQSFLNICPSQLRQELTNCPGYLVNPPIPYAMFLSFLCYHELGDRRRRDTALTQLRAMKYDEHQGASAYWIVNNLLGICYELVGDTRRAIREYQESLSGAKLEQQFNPAREKITRLQRS